MEKIVDRLLQDFISPILSSGGCVLIMKLNLNWITLQMKNIFKYMTLLSCIKLMTSFP